jgi:hypothetical protein
MIIYLTGASAYCAFLIFNLFNDQECSNTDSTSWIAVALASAFWVIVVPISLMEIRGKLKDRGKLNTVQSDVYQDMPEQIEATRTLV